MTNQSDQIKPVADKQQAPAMRFTINCVFDGFPVEIQGEGRGDLKAIIERLKAIGATPPSRGNDVTSTQADDAPTCEYHGSMKRSNHGGFYCPKKMGDGSYCKSKG